MFKKICIHLVEVYWKFQGGGGRKGQTLFKFPEEWKVSNQISLGVGEVWTFSETTQ